jgi:UDP-N-acetylglucosamine 2-epimerase
MLIVTIVGARPQFIKAAVVSRAIREHNMAGGPPVNEVIVHTGQHYDGNMSQVFFEELDIPTPAYNLGIDSCSHGSMTGRMLDIIVFVISFAMKSKRINVASQIVIVGKAHPPITVAAQGLGREKGSI